MLADESHDDRTQSYVALTKGTAVSHYEIVERIGSGGMGEVYLAHDTKLNRKVALKFLPPHLCQDEDCRKRFTREAQAAASLDHPNIAAIHEVGEYRGRPFYAMQIVEGQSLKEVIAGKAPEIEQIVEIGIQACGGLQAAHDKGIIHRDIKPSNILLDEHGRVRIVDFGLAAIRGSEQLTKTGSTLGTIGYMSPEQVQGKEIDHRSDLFSLGVVLYELITKQSPFKRDSEAATLKAVSDDLPEPLARFRSGLPEGLQAIVDKALDKDIKTRYQHADGVLSDLMRVRQSLESGQVPISGQVTAGRSSRVWSISAALIVIAAAIILIIAKPWQTKTASDKPERIMLAVLPFENLSDPEDAYFADGMTEEITSRLASVSSLGVISRTSTLGYRNTTMSIPEIGQELGVDYILEGTVRFDKTSEPPRIRIMPQLIRVEDDVHLWADQVEMPLEDVFHVQAQIARDIVAALDVRLVQAEPEWIERIPTHSTAAYQLLLRSRYVGEDPDLEPRQRFDSSIALIQNALEIDSSIAFAWALLGVCHSLMYHYGYDKTPQRRALADRCTKTALRLDPKLSEAHSGRGVFLYYCDRDYSNALVELEEALKDPGSMYDPSIYVAYILRRQGRFSEAVRLQEEHFKLNPRDAGVAREIGITYQAIGEYEKADEYYRKSIDIDPRKGFYSDAALNIASWKGDLAEMRRVLDKAPSRDHRLYWYLHLLQRDLGGALAHLDSLGIEIFIGQKYYWPMDLYRGLTYLWLGSGDLAKNHFEAAREIMEEQLEKTPDDFRVHAALGFAYAGLDKKGEALKYADRAVNTYPLERDALLGQQPLVDRVRIQILVGEYDSALDGIESLLAIPAADVMAVWFLKLDPVFDPLRDHPRFQALVKKYEKKHGT